MDKKIIVKVRGVVLHEGNLLVVKHAHDTSFAALPGGHLEWGEDVKECVKREIVEELGVEPEVGRLLYINNFSQTDGKQYLEFFFEVKNVTDYLDTTKLVGSHKHELAGLSWVAPTDDVQIYPKSFGKDFREGKIISNEVRYIKD